MKYKVLIVEDESQLMDLIRFTFEPNDDMEVKILTDEYAALSYMESNTIDAVLTDMQLNTHEGGLSVLKGALDRGIPVGVMTADVKFSDEHYLNLGASWVLRKPFEVSELPKIARRLASLND